MNLHNDDGTLNEAGQKIVDILDSKEFMSDLYEGLDDKTREELGQFYTPAKICIQMIEMFNATDFSGKNVLDPCCGSGNLLIAMLAAGADSDKVYGNDYDYRAVKLCRKRINRACDILGKPHIQDWQIHQGNALHEFALKEFRPDYTELYFGDSNEEDWEKLTPQQKGARTKKLIKPDYNAYAGKKFKALDKAAAEAIEHDAIISGNTAVANQDELEALQKTRDENQKEFEKNNCAKAESLFEGF